MINDNSKKVTNWEDGEIIKICLDCELWKVTFYLNNKMLFTMDIDKNKTYYPSVAMCGCTDNDFKLL